MTTALIVIAAIMAILPARMLIKNLWYYREPERPDEELLEKTKLSVLIPARNEEAMIGDALASVLANRDVDFELLVLDDHSEDATAEIVTNFAEKDPRVRLLEAPPLPSGWNGKMHACQVLAEHANNDLLVFLDADVRLSPDALGKFAAFMDKSGASLASGVPREITKSFGEKLIIPLIHFVLLAFLPLGRMRRSTHPAFASGIGQLVVAKRSEYFKAGGHAAIKTSRHDGVHLPQAFRRAGLMTDLFDATNLATCRMYGSTSETWQGFLKNADQGMGHPRSIVPLSALLLGGQVFPILLLPFWGWLSLTAQVATAVALVATFAARIAAAHRFHQSYLSAVLHPLGITVLVTIQWVALVRRLAGLPAVWKGRAYNPDGDADVEETKENPRSSAIPVMRHDEG